MIKVTLGESLPQENKPFPKVMKLKDVPYLTLVLFEEEAIGTVIYDNDPDDPYNIGHYHERWSMKSFDDFNISITLQNV